MTVDDIFALKQVSDPQISPDGKWVTYVVSIADFDRGRWDSDLWLVPVGQPSACPPADAQAESCATGARQLTFSVGQDSFPRWSPDSKTIAFLRARPEAGQSTAQIYLLPLAAGEPYALTNAQGGVSSFEWSPDGKSIHYLAAGPFSYPEIDPASPSPRKPSSPSGKAPQPRVEDEVKQLSRLWGIELATGQQRQLTPDRIHVREFAVSPDEKEIRFTGNLMTSDFDDLPQTEIYSVSREGGEPRQVTANRWPESGIEWSPDGKAFLFLAGADRQFQRATFQTSLFSFGEKNETHLPLALSGGNELLGTVEQAVWLNANHIVLVVGAGPVQNVYLYEFSLRLAEPLTAGNEIIGNVSVSRAGKIAFLRQTPSSANDVWLLDLWDPARPARTARRLTDHNPQLSGFELPRFETLRWNASDGVEVEGILLTPAEGKGPWPLVTSIHGGPASAEMAAFRAFASVLTGAGIAVFLPNYRGSTNYGEEFASRSIGDRNGRDARDIEEGIDALVARGVADAKRLGVMGWSAGGVLTNWIVANNTRYRAASTGAGVSDWRMQYFLSDYSWGSRLYFGGTPWEKAALYWERSPLRLAARVKTPVLIHCGENDERVPIQHARAWYRALRNHGVTARFVVYPGEPHGFRQPASQRRRHEEDVAWFRKHLLAP